MVTKKDLQIEVWPTIEKQKREGIKERVWSHGVMCTKKSPTWVGLV